MFNPLNPSKPLNKQPLEKDYSEWSPEELETEVMIHRYLYYVIVEPVLPDSEYDRLERIARSVLPESSDVHKVGSSLPASYSEEIRHRAVLRVTPRQRK